MVRYHPVNIDARMRTNAYRTDHSSASPSQCHKDNEQLIVHNPHPHPLAFQSGKKEGITKKQKSMSMKMNMKIERAAFWLNLKIEFESHFDHHHSYFSCLPRVWFL
jgi:hypothetical protein